MAPIRIKYVVSFSSQDERHTVENLLSGDVYGKKWLCSPSNRTGQMEATFQLEQLTHITHIDIGSYGCFTVSVQVGLSSWPQDRPYEMLVPAHNFMSAADSKQGKNKSKTQMFKRDEHFDRDISGLKWDRVKIVCSQPFKKDSQFGLMFLRIIEAASGEQKDKIQQPFSPQCRKSDKSNISFHTPQSHSTGKYSSLSWKSASQIQKHFFGDKKTKDAREEELKNRLVSIANTASNSSNSTEALPRTAQLVLKASIKSPQYAVKKSPLMKDIGNSRDTLKKTKLIFEEEVKKFLSEVNFDAIDMDKLTFADLRHQMEKRKCRKFCKEEKKIFFENAQAFITEMDYEKEEKRLGERTHSTANCKSSKSVDRKRKSTTDGDGSSIDKKVACPRTESARNVSKRSNITPQKSKRNGVKKTFFPGIKLKKLPKEIQEEMKSSIDLGSHTDPDEIQENSTTTECPLCGDKFSVNDIENHAATCGEDPSQTGPWLYYSQFTPSQSSFSHQTQSSPLFSSSENNNVEKVPCPICGRGFSVLDIEEHADSCVQMESQGFSLML